MGWIIGKGIGVPFRLGGSGLGSSYWATRTPSTLTLTNTGYPEGIKLDWLNGGADYDGTSIERSDDGVTYAEIDTVASGVLTYTDATAVFQTLYYYRVRAYKGTNYSPYSNAESLEVTSDRFIITVDTTKAGSAADTFVLPLPSTETYDYYVDWGDGGAEEHVTVNTSQTHVYAASGTYQIKIRGTFPTIYFNNGGDKDKLIYIDNWGNIAWTSMENAFYGCSNMNSTTIDTANTSLVTSFISAFRGCSSLTTLDTSGWDTAKVTSFGNAFYNCSSLTALNVSGWNTAKVTSFYYAFRSCSLLTTLDTSGWDTAEVTSFGSAFRSCSLLTTLDTSGWNTAKVTSFGNAFRDCSSLKTLDVSGWNTAKVTSFESAFYDSSSLKGDFSHIILNAATDIANMFFGDNINNTGTTTNYDALLIAWNADVNTPNSLNFHAGNSKYGDAAVAARANLVLPVGSGGKGWTITDGGHI